MDPGSNFGSGEPRIEWISQWGVPFRVRLLYSGTPPQMVAWTLSSKAAAFLVRPRLG